MTAQIRTAEVPNNFWIWILALGILLCMAGLVALSSWIFTALAFSIFFGWLLIAAGAFQLVGAFLYRQFGGFWAELLFSMLTLITGFLLVVWPVGGAGVIAFIAVGLLLLKGIVGAVNAVLSRSSGWVLQLLLAILMILVGGLLLGNQAAALAFIGLLIGLNLLMRGVTWIFMALEVRKLN